MYPLIYEWVQNMQTCSLQLWTFMFQLDTANAETLAIYLQSFEMQAVLRAL